MKNLKALKVCLFLKSRKCKFIYFISIISLPKTIKNTKDISFTNIPNAIQTTNTEKNEKFVDNLMSINTSKEKLNEEERNDTY